MVDMHDTKGAKVCQLISRCLQSHLPLSPSFTIYPMNFLRFLILLALAVWLGALIFFPVVAQTAFSVLPSTHQAGLVVRGTLITLHWMAFISGAIFLASSLIYNRITQGSSCPLSLSHLLVLVMLALTAISQFAIIPKMDTLVVPQVEINSLPPGNPVRVLFDSLHAWSTRLEGTVLVLGLIVLYATARRFNSART
jgi:hypothetical protein